jgi:vacuolar-type H+-ATPase subunit C/Vma6
MKEMLLHNSNNTAITTPYTKSTIDYRNVTTVLRTFLRYADLPNTILQNYYCTIKPSRERFVTLIFG